MVFLIVICTNLYCNAEDNGEKYRTLRLGFNYGFGTQQSFPFNFKDYTYDVQFYKFQINYELNAKTKWKIELNIEPGIYIANHQLLNVNYVQPRFGNDYLDQRLRFSKKKQINEYALNFGILFRYNICRQLSTYILGSVGPMISSIDTERLAKGFAFSDIFALGVSYMVNFIFLDLRFSLRHVSNANLQSPNSGHNSTNMEFGVSFQL